MHTPAAEALTQVILSVFRANGLLLQAGDRLVGPLGLTSARWQVLGAAAMSADPPTVPQIAAAMGVTRQGAQKQVNALVADGLMQQVPNPAHARSPLFTLTKNGRAAYEAAIKVQEKWANALAANHSPRELEAARNVLLALCDQLESIAERGKR